RKDKQDNAKSPDRKVLPATPLRADKLNAIDADVTLNAKRILRPKALAIDDLSARLTLDEGQLKLTPLRFGYAGGDITSNIALNARQHPYRVALDTRFSKLRLNELFPTVDWSKNSVGLLGGRLDLTSHGDTVGAMLGGANGKLELVTSGGELSSLLLEAIGLDGAEIIKYLVGRDQRSRLRCGVAVFDVREGRATSEQLVLDTDDTRIDGHGTIDFANETLSLTFDPKPKDVSIAVLRAPLYLAGSFGAPRFSVDKTTLLARGAAAVGLGLITPLAALIPLIETGPGEDANCQALLAQARKK
ncbi:MAG TPA: AsmA family protein, partial [Burkholderiaceae bacterium]|nr:AsmA family protein [Burkholderiaceae bacterium]